MTDKLIGINEKKRLFEESREAFGEAAFKRSLTPLHKGKLENPDGHACLTGRCGETLEIFLQFKGERVSRATFLTDGCGAITACGSYAAEMAIGKTPDGILEVTGDAIMGRLGGFPKEDAHCAFLAAETLQEALHSFMTRQAKSAK